MKPKEKIVEIYSKNPSNNERKKEQKNHAQKKELFAILQDKGSI